MPGIRGLKRCFCDSNMVWGLAAFPVVSGWQSGSEPLNDSTSGRTGPRRVRAKVAPYAADYAGTKAGELPNWEAPTPLATGKWPNIVDLYGPNVNGGWDFKRVCVCSRAVSVDGVQKCVNYLFVGSSHATVLNLTDVTTWHQVGLDPRDNTFGTSASYNVGLYDAMANVDRQPSRKIGDVSNDGSGASDAYTISQFSGQLWPDEGYFYKTPRPRAWYLGKRFFIASGYATSDYNRIGGNEWGIARFDNQGAAFATPGDNWYAPTVPSAGGFETVPFYIMRPSFRCYIDSKAEQPDEPWCIAYDYATQRIGVGRWIDMNGMSLAHRIEKIIISDTLAAGLGLTPNVVCYQHIYGRDIALFRGSWDVDLNQRSSATWLYDGERLTKLTEAPTFVTLDLDGNILYGNASFIRKTGPNGWKISTNNNVSVFPVGGVEPYWEIDGSDPPEGWEPAEATYPSEFREHSETFQIMCNRGWIQVRGFRGTQDMASGDINNKTGYHMASTANSRQRQLGGNAAMPIQGWSFSHDGQIKIPHVQPLTPYAGITSFYNETPNTDTLHRIVPRAYIDHDLSEWETGNGADPALSAWPKWESALFSVYANIAGSFSEYLPQFDFHDQFLGTFSSYQHTLRDVFPGATNYFDFDIVGDCPCGCPAHATPY